MHEASLISDLIEKIEKAVKAEGGGRVSQVRVRLGALSHISPEHFQEHFQQGAKGTVAENAGLQIQVSSDLKDPQAQDIVLDSVDIDS